MVPSTSTVTFGTPLRRKTLSSVTTCPPTVLLDPFDGEVGVGDGLWVPLGGGLDPLPLGLPHDDGEMSEGGIEKGSRPPNVTIGGTLNRGLGVAVTLGGGTTTDPEALGPVVATSLPPPPPRTFSRRKIKIAAPATPPRIMTARLSLSLSAMVRLPRSDPAGYHGR